MKKPSKNECREIASKYAKISKSDYSEIKDLFDDGSTQEFFDELEKLYSDKDTKFDRVDIVKEVYESGIKEINEKIKHLIVVEYYLKSLKGGE